VDAVRNRRRIMEAAREQITAHGPEAGMAAIADAAGVAVGTLYRNFPTKADLVSAVVREHAEQMVDNFEAAVKRVLNGAPILDEMRGAMERYIDLSAENRAVKAVADALGAHDFSDLETRAYLGADAIISAGRDAGVLRPDVVTDDFTLLVTTAPTHLPASARARWLTLFLDGLTTGATNLEQK
jgi:AcrR family transcriptional regulator